MRLTNKLILVPIIATQVPRQSLGNAGSNGATQLWWSETICAAKYCGSPFGASGIFTMTFDNYLIPLVNVPQTFQINCGNINYSLTSKWNDIGQTWI